MEFSPHALKFMTASLLDGQEGSAPELVTALFDWISKIVAEKDAKIEPSADVDRMRRKFRHLMMEKRFFPSFEWLRYFGKSQGLLLDTPMDYLGGVSLPRTSLADSEVLNHLDGDEPYRLDVPSSFLKALDKQAAWPINYRHEPFASGEVPSVQLWEALAAQMKRSGAPVMHFPEAQRTETQLNNPGGRMVRGVLNLSRMVNVRDGKYFLDWNRIVDTVVQGVRMLDALVEVAEDQSGDGYIKTVRRIGIGLIGWAELLIKLETPYESDEALDLARRLMKFVSAAVQEASAALVKYRPAVEGAFVRIRGFEEPVRNLCRLYVLPEDELAFMAETSPGLEPLAGLAGRYHGYLEDESPMIVHPLLLEYLKARGGMTERIMDQLLDDGTLDEDSNLPDEVLDLFRTRSEIPIQKLLDHQLIVQGFCEDLVVQRLWTNGNLSEELIKSVFSSAVRRRGRSLWVQPLSKQSNLSYTLGSTSNS